MPRAAGWSVFVLSILFTGLLARGCEDTPQDDGRNDTQREPEDMARTFELMTPIDGTVEEAWSVLTDFTSYAQWNRLVPFGRGSATQGARLELRLRGRLGRFRPTVVSIDAPRELILEDSVGHRTLIHMTHGFTFLPTSRPPGVLLRQRWRAEGALVPLVWLLLRRDMARFEEFGLDLSRRVVERRLLNTKRETLK